MGKLGLESNRMAREITTFESRGKRPHQEDHLLIDQEKGVFVVADGFGGPTAGTEAAKKCCESVRSFLYREAGDLEATLPFILREYFSLAGNVLFNSLIHANRQVFKSNHGKTGNEKGGASVVAGFVDGDLLVVGNVGCCQAYLFREGEARAIVQPRTFGTLVDPFEKENLQLKQIPLRAVGMVEDLEPEIMELRIRSDDWLLLATDGLQKDVLPKVAKIQASRKPAKIAIREVKQLISTISFDDNASISLMIF